MSSSNNLSGSDLELLSAYIDDELTAVEKAALEVRLQAEPNLRHELNELRVIVQAVQNLPSVRAPRNFTLIPEMVADVPARQKAASFLLFPTSAMFSAISAAAATLLIVFGALLLFMQSTTMGSMAPVAMENIQQAPGDVAALPTDTPQSIIASTILPAMTITVPPSSPTSQPTATAFAMPTLAAPVPPAQDGDFEIAEEAEEVPAEPDLQDEALQTETQSAQASGADLRVESTQIAQLEESETIEESDLDDGLFMSDTVTVITEEAQQNIASTPAPTLGAAAGGAALAPTQTSTETLGSRILSTAPVSTRIASYSDQDEIEPSSYEMPVDPTLALSLGIIMLGVLLMVVAIGTTVVRRSSSRGGT